MTSDETRATRKPPTCTQSWEALRGDSLGWLLDPTRPNLHWRVLVELVGRPEGSPAVRRARGGANASAPVAELLADLHPDGCWATSTPMWNRFEGPGWRLAAAVQLGADPEDPRLHAASEQLLGTAPGEGGLSAAVGDDPDPALTARALEAMTALGWGKHSRVQEWLAWFEATSGWERNPVAAVAVLKASGARQALRERSVEGLDVMLGSDLDDLAELGHPNLLDTDLAEVFTAFEGAGIAWREPWRSALRRLQDIQGEGGRWPAGDPEAARWVTLQATNALLTYAVVAKLPRFFPFPPSQRL